jgi:hypothetical protein
MARQSRRRAGRLHVTSEHRAREALNLINEELITLSITSAEDERVLNKSTTSTIETFRPNELIVKSDTEGTSTFIR